jgi:hypothetical protein
MRRVSSIIAAVAGISVTLIAPAASAADGSAGNRGWEPFRTQPFVSTDVCSFTIRGDIVKDEEEVRTDATYPDGSAKVQEFRGPLVIRFTNTGSGRSVVRDVSGYALLHFKQDGGSTWFFDGGGSIGVHLGNKATPPGSYILQGKFVFELSADGTRDIHRLHASMENLCTTLA